MRVYALYVVVAFFSIYAYRHWFRSLCVLILLMAFIEHPDMPKSILGIQGMNPWNALLLNVMFGWLISRRREGLRWDLPRAVNLLLIGYLLVILVAFVRMITDTSQLKDFTTASLISENLVNTLKWPIPGLLMFDGCRTRPRLAWGVASVLMLYFLLAVQVIRWMPASAAISGSSLDARSRKIILNEVGYHRVNMSMMLCGASWAILSITAVVRGARNRGLVVLAFLVVVYAQALTGGRMGYVTWGVVGLAMCLMRWRKMLLFAPLVPIVIALVAPGTAERMFQGFGATNIAGETITDDYQATAGRTLIWPHVIDKIGESPGVGYGRLAMRRTGLTDYLMSQYGESFPHPHNAYLQCLLDNGIIGFAIIIAVYGMVLLKAARLFRDQQETWCVAVGGIGFALVFSLLVASMGSQTFYPREGAVGMWVAMGLVWRVAIQRPRRTASFGLR